MKGNFPLHYMSLLKHPIIALCIIFLIKAPFSSKAGAIFSGIGKNHVGIVLSYDGTNITIQDGNYDGKTNTFEDAKSDWKTVTYTLDEYRIRLGGVVFANPK